MKRVLTGLILALVIVSAFLMREINIYIFDICIGILTVFAALEVAKLLKKANKFNMVLPSVIFPSIAYITIILGMNAGWGVGKLLVTIALLVVVAFAIMLVTLLCFRDRMMVEKKLKNYTGSTFAYIMKICKDTLFTFVYPVLFLLLFVVMNHFDNFASEISKIVNFGSADIGLIMLIMTIVIASASDVFALYVGTLIGGKKLCPNISPNKTVSGAIGGVVGTMLVSALMFIIFCTQPAVANGFQLSNITMLTFIILGLLGSVVCQLGDLFESVLKRKSNVKDSGKFLPGHGGLMDRLDGLTFNVVFTLLFFVVILL